MNNDVQLYEEIRRLHRQLEDSWSQEEDAQRMMLHILRERADAMSTLLVKQRLMRAAVAEGTEMLGQRIACMDELMALIRRVTDPEVRASGELIAQLDKDVDRVKRVHSGLQVMLPALDQDIVNMETTLQGYTKQADDMRDTIAEREAEDDS